MTNGSVHPEDITTLNTNAPNNKASKHIEQKLLELEEEKYRLTIILGDFISLSQ